jgi:cytidine deaminase
LIETPTKQEESDVEFLETHMLIKRATDVIFHRKIGRRIVGDVGCALVSSNANLYLGVCADIVCGLGFCAEQSAVGAMINAGETKIAQIVAVWKEGPLATPQIWPLCERCRELLYQIDRGNLATAVILSDDRSVTLRELLPNRYLAAWEDQ